MDFLQNLQSMLGSAMGSGNETPSRPAPGGSGGSGLGGLLNSDVLGSLAGALFSNKTGTTAASGGSGMGGGLGGLLAMLLGGGGGDLLGKFLGGGDAAAAPRSQIHSAPPAAPSSSPLSESTMRAIRTLIYAAKADGHIDDKEQAAIDEQVRKLDLGQEARSMIQQAMDEKIDPNRIASGLTDPKEALQLYVVSYAVCDPDNFMEQSYLDGLAKALSIPDSMKAEIATRLRGR